MALWAYNALHRVGLALLFPTGPGPFQRLAAVYSTTGISLSSTSRSEEHTIVLPATWTFSPNVREISYFMEQVNNHFQAIDHFLAGPDQRTQCYQQTKHAASGCAANSWSGSNINISVGKRARSYAYWRIIDTSDVVTTPNSPPGTGPEPNHKLPACRPALRYRVNF